MKRIVYCLISLVLILSSCSYSPYYCLTISPYINNPWEEVTGKEMWYKVVYFDGVEVHTKYLDRGEWKIKVNALSSALSAFVFYPLGNLSPIGGFYEGGRERRVYLKSEDGEFAECLIELATQYPEAVGALSLVELRKITSSLSAIDRTSFISNLLSDTLHSGSIKLNKRYRIPIEGVIKGEWVALSSHQDSIVITTVSSPYYLYLFPGRYYYLSRERNLMLSIAVSEEGEYWTRVSPSPIF